MVTKKQAQRIHAKRRAAQRYGLDLNRHEMTAIVQAIQANKGRFVGRQSNRVTIWDVVIGERDCRVVYDSDRKSVVTFLPAAAHGGKE